MMTAVLMSLMLINADESPADAAKPTELDLQWRADARCGPNCLYLMLFMCGKKADYDVLMSKFKLETSGVNVADLVRTSEEFGLPLTPLRTNAVALAEAPLPAIVHCRSVVSEGGHYLLLLRIDKNDTMTVIGGTTGQMERMAKGDFYDLWTGVVLVRSDRWEEGRLDWLLLLCSAALLLAFSLVCVWWWRRLRAVRKVV